ncbi:MAG: hypothetical protein NVSMB24_34160 [Mucilaginibacter sp.]
MKRKIAISVMLVCLFGIKDLTAQNVKLNLDLQKKGIPVSPELYGLMTEEINHSYDGGLYGELIRNRILKDAGFPENWKVLGDHDRKAMIVLDHKNPVNAALSVCLRLDVEEGQGRAGIINEGYWGIPIKPKTSYRASFFAKCNDAAAGPITVAIEGNDGKNTFASGTVTIGKGDWKKYEVTLNTDSTVKSLTTGRFVISTSRTGTYWFNLVSLFPPTYHNRPNGNRVDLMQLMSDMKPAFLRLPGGNYLEGDQFSSRFAWKSTLGDLENRPGHPGCWGYRSSDGMGLLEYLDWCEDLNIQPVLAIFAGYTLKGDHLEGPLLQPFVDEAMEEIEYIAGDVHTKWGTERARDGHPKPFKLNYLEIGNEDGFDRSGSYETRFTQFFDAIKTKYPKLHLISTVGGLDPLGKRYEVRTRKVEVIDEHYYRSASEMEADASHYDNYDRKGPKIFVGEWATREGSPTPNMNAALGDAAWMTGMERNADHVIMSCYAPLFVNVNKGGMQWGSDLIGFDAVKSYGSPSYYAQVMFSNHIGNQVVPVSGDNIPTQITHLTKKDSAAGEKPKVIPAFFYVATKDTKTGTLYLKVVNATGKPQTVTITLGGMRRVSSQGKLIVLKGLKPEDTNSIEEPEKIKPVTRNIKSITKIFTQVFDPYSVNVLQMQVQ